MRLVLALAAAGAACLLAQPALATGIDTGIGLGSPPSVPVPSTPSASWDCQQGRTQRTDVALLGVDIVVWLTRAQCEVNN